MQKSALLKLFVLFLGLNFNYACSSLNQKSSDAVKSNDELKVKAFWVKDTLNHPNLTFRKVNRFSPLLYKDLIIAANSTEGLVAYDVYDQSTKWTLPVRLGVEASGAIINSRLFVGGLNGIFYSIDLDSAKVLWQFDTQSEIEAEPLLLDGFVYFISGANILYCLDATNGRQIWVYNRQDTSTAMTVRGGGRPAYDNGQIYQGFSDGSLVSINAKTGTPNWEVLLNKNSKFRDLDATPVIDKDTIYINSYDDKLYAVSKSSGTILWKSENGGASQPVIFGDYLTYTSSKGHLFVVAKKSGDMVWKVTNLKGIGSDPILHKGLIVVGESQGRILFYDSLSGSLKGSFDPGRGILGRPVSDKKYRVYFMSGEANLYGLHVDYEKRNSNFSFIE